jgi:O-6-methylguanine DNA methyltransferase
MPKSRDKQLQLVTFSTELGWAAIVASPWVVKQIAFAYPSAAAALRSLDEELLVHVGDGDDWQFLVRRIQDFAAGKRVDFDDVKIDLDSLTPFRRRVIKHCRAIPYGSTLTYGELAALAGSPRAARAVGSTMATNRCGIVVPCHRVTGSGGKPGAYGGPYGTPFKIRLLAMEQQTMAGLGKRAKTAGGARRRAKR